MSSSTVASDSSRLCTHSCIAEALPAHDRYVEKLNRWYDWLGDETVATNVQRLMLFKLIESTNAKRHAGKEWANEGEDLIPSAADLRDMLDQCRYARFRAQVERLRNPRCGRGREVRGADRTGRAAVSEGVWDHPRWRLRSGRPSAPRHRTVEGRFLPKLSWAGSPQDGGSAAGTLNVAWRGLGTDRQMRGHRFMVDRGALETGRRHRRRGLGAGDHPVPSTLAEQAATEHHREAAAGGLRTGVRPDSPPPRQAPPGRPTPQRVRDRGDASWM